MMQRLTRRRGLAWVSALVAGLVACAATAPAQAPPSAATGAPIVVFAAASLKTALEDIALVWGRQQGVKVVYSFASSSALVKQIEHGAPADLFISADAAWMAYAEEKKLVDPATRVSLAGNTLVLIAPSDSTVQVELTGKASLVAALGDGKLAMGDPKTVPAGSYAAAALRSLGLWEEVAAKIAGTENVRAALAYVARGEAPLGIVYGSDALSEPKVRVVATFPKESHPAIVYPAALTTETRNPQAKAFLDALAKSPDMRAIFAARGFTSPE